MKNPTFVNTPNVWLDPLSRKQILSTKVLNWDDILDAILGRIGLGPSTVNVV